MVFSEVPIMLKFIVLIFLIYNGTTGVVAKINHGRFPWAVVISENNSLIAGGSLIHPSLILTSAIALHGKKAAELGVSYKSQKPSQEWYEAVWQDRNVSRIIIHENFNGGNNSNDFALLVLSQPAETVITISLPQLNFHINKTCCRVSGWDEKYFFGGWPKQAEFRILDNKICEKSIRKSNSRASFKLPKSSICAGDENGTGQCVGIIGDPLICPLEKDQNQYVLVGSVSQAITCSESGVPDLYSNILTARQWIYHKMKNLNFHNSL